MSFPIPDSALAQHIAILGKTGSGKTTAAKGAVELILDTVDDAARPCIIDPTGAWWGMKSSVTGKSAGYPFVIFGGEHADFPLAAAHGEAIAEIVGTTNTPAIIDTSQMRISERTKFFTEFADAIMRKNRGPLHLIIDEAHMFMPQGKVPDPSSGMMLAAGNHLVSGGRSRGLRIILITQRPAKLHKDALTQVETLVAMRLIAPQDRKAVEEWIKDNADASKGREIIESLATLKTGEAWVWAPEIRLLDRVKFPRIKTFDSSAAPTGEANGKGPVLASINRDSISDRLKVHAEQVAANDPAELKRRIRELERQLAEKSKPGATEEELKEAGARGMELGLQAGLCRAFTEIEALAERMTKDLPRIDARPENPGRRVLEGRRPAEAPSERRTGTAPSLPRARQIDGRASSLPKGEAATLTALIQFPHGLRREQLTVLTGYKRSSRDAYIQRLREKDLVEIVGDTVAATGKGIDALPDVEPLPTGKALQEHWFRELPKGEADILRVLVRAYPRSVARADLDDETGFARSSRDAYLQRLSAKQLVSEPSRGEVRASEDLF